MKRFKRLPEFEKDLKRLLKKYRSLQDDLSVFEQVIEIAPTGIGKNFTIIHYSEEIQVVKARLACKSLQDRSMRIIYAYHKNIVTFMHIELYFKGDKENEDRDRLAKYLESGL
ncbi:hypothetical protein KKA27_01285 [Patescibacteria group bacterium]|nr:hypothetical protein [Patescibacteria group bacterium]MBU2633497.1 hypothetical protein [Patescibacteria group bacterium]